MVTTTTRSGSATSGPASSLVASSRSSIGIVGLKERVTTFGGEPPARPRDGDGWEVRAAFPVGGT